MDELNVLNAISTSIWNSDRLATAGIETVDVSVHRMVGASRIDMVWLFKYSEELVECMCELKLGASSIASPDIAQLGEMFQVADKPNALRFLLTTASVDAETSDLAKASGIHVIEPIDISEEDWEGKIRSVRIQMNYVVPKYEGFRFNHNREQAKELLSKTSEEKRSLSFSFSSDDLYFKDGNGRKIRNLASVFEQYGPAKDEGTRHVKHEFTDPTFIDTDLGPLRIDSVEFDVVTNIVKHPIVVDAARNVGFKLGYAFVKYVVDNVSRLLSINQKSGLDTGAQ